MYKNRSRGLRRPPLTSTSSALDRDGDEQLSSIVREPLRQREPSNVLPQNGSQRESIDDPVDRRPSKRNASENNEDGSNETSTGSPRRESELSRAPNRHVRERNVKSNLLNNYVDVDVDTMFMTFSSKFEELITKSGLILQNNNDPFLLRKDQAVFIRNLSILLSEKEENVDLFLEGLGKFMEKNSNFKKMLFDTQTDPSFEDARSSVQDSLIRMLLCVDSIQPKVIVLLLEKVVEFIQRSAEEIRQDETPWIEMIVKRLCFLDRVVDGTALYNDLFRLLAMAPITVQQEIIYNLPYIMGDAHHDEVASRLVTLMDSKQELTAAVLEALGHMPLSGERNDEIRTRMMNSLKRTRVEYLPIIVKNLSLEQQAAYHDEVINGLRMGLPFTRVGDRLILQDQMSQQISGTSRAMHHSNRAVTLEDLASSKALTFRNLRGAFLSMPSLARSWLRNIRSIESAKDHRPIDIAMLLMMHSKASNRRKQVESVWRNRIKSGAFTDALLEETFEVLLEVLKRHKDDVLNVASVLLRVCEPSVRDYGSTMFKLAFVHFDSHIRRQVISDLIVLAGSGDSAAQPALEVLLQLAETHYDKLCRLTVLLQNLLDNIDKLNLSGVRQMMDLLCRMTYASDVEEESTLGDNISIIVHKQLGSLDPILKRKGIVSAIMMLKHMIGCCGNGDSDANISLESSLESLPPGRPKDASELLNLVLRSTRTLPEALGYCFDQLSFMMSRCSSLDRSFLLYVTERMEEMFMASYLPEEEQVNTRGGGLEINLSSQYLLDKDSEERIELGIGALVLKEARSASERGGRFSTDNTFPLLVLNPLFRLLRVLKHRSGDVNLEGIDALLGCALLMPSDEMITDFNTFGPNQQSEILNCLFYCVNWFREIVNAFACCEPQSYVSKVIIRLRNIVALQSTLAKLLGNVVHYTPPQCMFYEKSKRVILKPPAEKKKAGKGKRGRKKKKKKLNDTATLNDSTAGGQAADDSDTDLDKENEEDANGPVDIGLYRNFFREIDMDVFTLLKTELVMTPRPEQGGETTPEFGPSELRFLLEDYVAKLEHSLPSGATNRFALYRSAVSEGAGSFVMYDMIPVSEKAINAVSMLPVLCEKLEIVAESCRNLLDANDGIIDGPGMFVEGTADIKICFTLLLRAMCATFAWNGFQSVHNSELLIKGLKVLATRLDGHVGRRTSVVAFVEEAAGYLKRFHEWILQLDAGAYLVKLLQVLSVLWELDASRSSSRQNRINPTRSVLKEVCHSFLSRSWSTVEGALEKGAAYTTHIDVLARVYLDSEEQKLTLLEELVPKMLKESKDLHNKESPLETFPAICKYNFCILCRAIYDALVKGIQAEVKKKNSSEDNIKIWSTVFKILEDMVDITQHYTSRNYLSAMLRYGWTVLKLFLDKGMPVLESCLRHNTDEVTAIFRSSQVTTRFLNKICLSSKTSQDSVLTARVPQVRALLETLLYRVKAMLALNNVQSVWHMGNLRNRDIHNNELSTQDSNDADESDLPEPEEDKDDDITALDSEDDEEQDSRRKVSQKRRGKKRKSRNDNDEDSDEAERGSDDESNDTSVSTTY